MRVDRANELSTVDFVPLTSFPMPNEEVDVSIVVRSPVAPGLYTGYFKLCTENGVKFGQRLRCQLLSVSDDKLKIWEQLEGMGLIQKGERPPAISNLIISEQGDINRIINLLKTN